MPLSKTLLGAGLLLASVILPAQAEEAQCASVTLGDPGWSDIAVTNGIARFILDGLGYQVKLQTLGVPIIFTGLQKGQIDAFLGNWMPAQKNHYEAFVAKGEIDKLVENLSGTEYTLAVPAYAYEAGVREFADLAKYAERFNRKIYGIGSGAPANESIKEMIAANEFDLKDWSLVESSEQAMLVQVGRAVRQQQFIAFLGWTPHPMNVQYDMRYLKGGEQYFGESGTVNTLARKGYAQACPNVGKLLSNLTFTQDMENAIMEQVLVRQASNADAIRAWLKANPQVIDRWLEGVTTRTGEQGAAAVKAKL